MRLRILWIVTPALALAVVQPASAQDPERLAMAGLRISTDAGVARSCTRIGYVTDENFRTCGGRRCGWAATPWCSRSAPTT